eukprot:CAMPEP_0170252658 /NCGR_PEP_ID=MMETSP0116_2-20130129/26165_1 /TAXON_ID=400756 /ORGANISM="Durinskia baltica, Strain CSIRO CS-38" /LENGTH=338 /DNA_ID=CAMNT_0010503633 /DNA_START=70 /DNA_END=1085 /DNA_ORIENTATION=+
MKEPSRRSCAFGGKCQIAAAFVLSSFGVLAVYLLPSDVKGQLAEIHGDFVAAPTTLCRHGIDPAFLPVKILARSTKPEGHEFCMYLHDHRFDSWLSREIYKNGMVEPHVTQFLKEHIEIVAETGAQRIHVLDVGGNIGWTTLFSLAVDPRVVVTVAEPLPWHRELLEASVKLNDWEDRVRIIPKALTRESQLQATSALCMTVNPGNAASTMVKNRLTKQQCAEQGGNMVEMTTIDRALEENKFGPVDILKIDVEGYEPWALEGAPQLLSNSAPRAVISEWIGFRIKATGWEHPPPDFFDKFFPPDNWSYSVAGIDYVKGYEGREEFDTLLGTAVLQIL